MSNLITYLIDRAQNENGQALAELALIMAFILAVCIVAVTLMGLAVVGSLNNFMDAVS